MQLSANSRLQNGKYRIISVLGQGGFGITYLAENTFFEKKVAIKEFFPKDFCGRDNTSHVTLGTQNNAETVARLMARFLKEAKNIAKLDHPGIVKIHDIFEENDTAYYVMDYIEGENLNEIVKRQGPLSEEKAVGYICKVGEALEYIHSRQMTHFDVKPANIMIRHDDDRPILIDFGLSKQFDNHGAPTTTLMQGVSNGYSPIELYTPDTITSFSPQTDVYSLAATLLYLIVGVTPTSALTLINTSVDIPPEISTAISQAIKKAMEGIIANRYQSVKLFLSDLTTSGIDTSTQTIRDCPNRISLPSAASVIKPVDGISQWYIIDEDKKNGDCLACDFGYLNTSISNIDISRLSGNQRNRPDDLVLMAWIAEFGIGCPSNESTALQLYREAAKMGSSDAIYHLGRLHHIGLLLPADLMKACYYYDQAAKLGHLNALDSLAWMYYKGHGVLQDYNKAREFYEQAASEGHTDAQHMLAMIYDDGIGTPANATIAFKWFSKAAVCDNIAQYIVGEMYENGRGIEKDLDKAIEAYYQAANNGNAEAQNKLGDLFKRGQIVRQDLSIAHKWYLKAAENGNSYAQNSLGEMYCNGQGVDIEYDKALKWFRNAATKNNRAAQYNLGEMYYSGKGVKRDRVKAIKWYKKAAQNGFAKAQRDLGDIYYYGIDVEIDYVKATEFYIKAASNGYVDAKLQLGYIYHIGLGTKINIKKAIEWYLDAANNGNREAQYNIAEFFYHGIGVKKNIKAALSWYTKAHKQGYDISITPFEKSISTIAATITILFVTPPGFGIIMMIDSYPSIWRLFEDCWQEFVIPCISCGVLIYLIWLIICRLREYYFKRRIIKSNK